MPGKAGSWDAGADRTLLLGILKTHNVSVDNEAMAKYMVNEGYQFTASAIQSRMVRLKKMVKDGNADSDDTPKSGRKRGVTVALDGETPARKAKTAKKSAKATTTDGEDDALKQEDESEGDLV